jgi:hypothetical protein
MKPLAIVIAAWLSAAPGLAQEDFAPEGDAWNGISHLIRMAREQQIQVRLVDRLDAGTLQPRDALLMLGPENAPSSSPVTAFLRAGGRVALADDYAAGDSLLATFQISRREPTPDRAPQLRGNAALLVARARGHHRLTSGVRALVTNHPTVVSHRELAPIFELSEGEAVVLAGAVGEGRLVAIGDPSVLINNMMDLSGNRQFAENLLAYLEGGRGGTLYVLGPDARLAGRYGEPGADRPLHEPRALLEALATVDLPPLALRITTCALALIAAMLALGTLPTRSPYRSEQMFARSSSHGGFVGRVRYFASGKANLIAPLMVYKFELEAELLKRLGLTEQTLLRDVLSAAKKKGLREADLNAMRQLLLTLDELRDQLDRPPAPPSVPARRFRSLVATGERILSLLGPASAGRTAT